MPLLSWQPWVVCLFVVFWMAFGAVSLPRKGRYIVGALTTLLLLVLLSIEWGLVDLTVKVIATQLHPK